jgi:uncharacterized protein YijF (DUF1287 family)
MSTSYRDRDMDIQIRITNLMDYHDNKYPLSWYESMTDKQIKGMYSDVMVAYANQVINRMH